MRSPWAVAEDPYRPPGWWEDLGLGADEFVGDDELPTET